MGVHLNLGLVPCIQDHANHKLSVSQGHASEGHILVEERLLGAAWIRHDVALKLVDQVVRYVALHNWTEVLVVELLLDTPTSQTLWNIFGFQIGLTIQIFCLYIENSIGVR